MVMILMVMMMMMVIIRIIDDDDDDDLRQASLGFICALQNSPNSPIPLDEWSETLLHHLEPKWLVSDQCPQEGAFTADAAVALREDFEAFLIRLLHTVLSLRKWSGTAKVVAV